VSTASIRFPFSIELSEQHVALRNTLRWVEAEMARKRERVFDERRFLGLFRTWADHLRLHFRFEEEHGFEGGLGSLDQEIRELTGCFVRQHRSLQTRLDALLALTTARPPGIEPAVLLEELLRFFHELRRHDVLENAVLDRISRPESSA